LKVKAHIFIPPEERSFPTPKFPSSQSKVAPISQANLQATIKAAMARAPVRNMTLPMKMDKLRQMKSDDPIQQLQSDILSDFYDAIKELQIMVDPRVLLYPEFDILF
jgi:hypothetical protein